MKELVPGQVVRSLAGRDKGQFMVVCKILDQNYVLICDGDLRKVSLPKKKKVKHLAKTNHIVTILHEKLENGDKVTNAEVRNCLKQYQNEKIDDEHSEEV